MKKFLTAVLIALGVIACTKYDDTEIRGEIDNLKAQVDALDVQLQKTNANMNALQAIVDGLDGNEYITAIEDVKDSEGNVIGYTITFAQAGRKTIYNGKDGHSPAIQAVMHPELDVYCWQLDGEWLLADGKAVPVAGATPQLKLENGTWMISYDGTTWNQVSVTGEDVTVVCQFESVNVNESENCVTFVIASGETFTLPLGARFAIQFPAESVNVQEGETVDVAYTIIGADEDTDIYVVVSDAGWKASVVRTDYKSGNIKVTAPDAAQKGTVLVCASNHKGQSDLCGLSLSTEVLLYENLEDRLLLSIGDKITVDVVTNIAYTVNIDASWLKHDATAPTKAMRYETLTFTAEKNPTDQIRVANVSLLDAEGNAVQTFAISQEKNGGDFVLHWAYSDASLTPSFGYTEPAIDADGNVFVLSNNTLIKINADGTMAWSKTLGAWGGSCPDVTPSLEADGSVVYTAGGNDDVVGVYALDATNGSEKWTIGYDDFFNVNRHNALSFWRAGVAVGDEHLFVSCTRGHSVNAFSKTNGSRTSYMATVADGSKMHYSLTNSPVLTEDGVVAAKASQGLVGASRSIMEYPVDDFETHDQNYFAPCGIFTSYKGWNFNDRCPAIAVKYDDVNYVVSGGTESNKHHFHLWCQKSSKGLSTDIPTLPGNNATNVDYVCTIHAMKQTPSTGGGGLVAGARNEIIVSAEPADPAFVTNFPNGYTTGGFVAVWPAKTDMTDALAYRFEHDAIIPASCAVDNKGYVHAVDINGVYFILKPDYENKTVEVVRNIKIVNLLEGCGVAALTGVTSATVKSSVKLGIDGKIYINATFANDETKVGGTLCFSYVETTGINATSSWPQAGADPMNTNRQVGYTPITNNK